VLVDREQRTVPRELVRPVSGEAAPALGREEPCELGDQGFPAIE